MPIFEAMIHLPPPEVVDLFGQRIPHKHAKKRVAFEAQHESQARDVLIAAYPEMRAFQFSGVTRRPEFLTGGKPTQAALFHMGGTANQGILFEEEQPLEPSRPAIIHTSEPPSIVSALAQLSHTAEIVTPPTITEPEPPALFEADAIFAESLPEPEPENPVGMAEYNIFNDRILARFNHRLSDEEAATIKGAKFQWWPGRRVWSAKWSVEAVDALAALGIPEGEIMDNDQPDNAEDRAERYLGYGEKAEQSAEQTAAYLAMRANTERRRRLAQGKLDNETEKAEYWRERAAGSLRWSEYRAQPAVIKRRIEGLESQARKHAKAAANALEDMQLRYATPMLKDGRVRYFLHQDKKEQVEREAAAIRIYNERWLEHTEMLLAFQHELYKASGGLVTDEKRPEVGGAVFVGGYWCEVEKVNKKTVQIHDRNTGFAFLRHRKVDITSISRMMSRSEWSEWQAKQEVDRA